MAKYGKCCSCSTTCPDISELPDWTIDGFTNSGWFQYGTCCWVRNYSRVSMSDGIQISNQALWERTISAEVEQDFHGWWVREFWRPDGPPPVGSLYPVAVPNTCWNAYGLIATVSYESEKQERARQEMQFQIADIQVLIQQIFNTCTSETEYYVRVNATVRYSNRINQISYSRNTRTLSYIDTCYEPSIPANFGTFETGTTTYTPLAPIWNTVSVSSLRKYSTLADIPATLVVDLTVSPVTSVDEGCFSGGCSPSDPVVLSLCYSPPSYTPPSAYTFGLALQSNTDNCLLSSINMDSHGIWSVCNNASPGVIPSPGGDILIRFASNGCFVPGTPGAGTTGFGYANSSVTSCSSHVYNTLVIVVSSDLTIPAITGVIRRKASCSPADTIACDVWWGAPKTYPVTNTYRDLNHTSNLSTPSSSPICMSPTTFTLA
jgi:hypothetical protein